jgi:hypothetical protein
VGKRSSERDFLEVSQVAVPATSAVFVLASSLAPPHRAPRPLLVFAHSLLQGRPTYACPSRLARSVTCLVLTVLRAGMLSGAFAHILAPAMYMPMYCVHHPLRALYEPPLLARG